MRLIQLALRRPFTVLALTAAVALTAILAVLRMPVDVFPQLDLPVIYVAQPFGGMAPSQMEGYLVNYYETNFLYLTGLQRVESRSIQNVALIKLTFQPGTNMNQAVSETISYVERSRAYMPSNTVAPFILRFDADSVPIGDLVFSSPQRTQSELDDIAQVRVRPILATLPGVAVPPPFGGNPRTVVISLNREQMESHRLSPDDLLKALVSGNTVLPAGNLRVNQQNRIVELNTVATHYQDLLNLPLRAGSGPTFFLRDVATISADSDVTAGYAELNGHRVVYIPITKRSGSSTLDVVNRVKAALPAMRAQAPDDVQINLRFDQSVYVRDALSSLLIEGLMGALLTGLAVWLFLGDGRSSLIVVIMIPFALLAAVVGLWLAGQTLNIMTLGGLALAVGILVDEATVAIENIHTHLGMGKGVAHAVFDSGREVMVPRLLAMLSVVAVFLPSFFMVGVGRSLFVPLSLSVGFAMVASWLLSTTLVPILAIWLLRHHAPHPAQPVLHGEHHEQGRFARLRRRVEALVRRLMPQRRRWIVLYLAASAVLIAGLGQVVGTDIFPAADNGQFQLRLRAPAGTRLHVNEENYLHALQILEREAGPGNVEATLGYVGAHPRSYPVNNIYLWTSGPHEAVMQVALKPEAHIRAEEFKEKLRAALHREMPDTEVSFEAGDIISQVMNLGSPTPVVVNVSGLDLQQDEAYADQLRQRLARISELRDLQYGQPRAYPAVLVDADRERMGQLGLTMSDVGRSLTEVTASSRFVARSFWQDPNTGVTYQVQMQMPPAQLNSLESLSGLPLADPNHGAGQSDPSSKPVLLGDVVQPRFGTIQGEYDHDQLQRTLSLTANLHRSDLGHAAADVERVLKVTPPPRGIRVAVRGQIEPMLQTLSGLRVGLLLSIVVIFLLLLASFQSWRLALVVLSSVPAVLAGVLLMLFATRTTLNIESFMGAIMSIGIAVANGILLVTMAESRRKSRGAEMFDLLPDGAGDLRQQPQNLLAPLASDAAAEATGMRLRPILMTSCAMIAGMIPMALALERGSEQSAPLGRAVIGGLIASTLATLVIMPLVFAALQKRSSLQSVSLDPNDPARLALPEPEPEDLAGTV